MLPRLSQAWLAFGELTDGKKRLHIFRFDSRIHRQLEELHDKNEAAAFKNCDTIFFSTSTNTSDIVNTAKFSFIHVFHY